MQKEDGGGFRPKEAKQEVVPDDLFIAREDLEDIAKILGVDIKDVHNAFKSNFVSRDEKSVDGLLEYKFIKHQVITQEEIKSKTGYESDREGVEVQVKVTDDEKKNRSADFVVCLAVGDNGIKFNNPKLIVIEMGDRSELDDEDEW